ncbi:MAG: zinc ribbon domain-containing protein [Methylotenera sp.]|nr:zinc ribbon domain-containing protein [Methylotenera sp.]
MPIYDYQCASCGYKDEVMRKMSELSTEACPVCGAHAFSKQLSAPSFQLNGSGWYATDFKNGNATGKKDGGTEKKPEAAAPAAGCATGCACH